MCITASQFGFLWSLYMADAHSEYVIKITLLTKLIIQALKSRIRHRVFPLSVARKLSFNGILPVIRILPGLNDQHFCYCYLNLSNVQCKGSNSNCSQHIFWCHFRHRNSEELWGVLRRNVCLTKGNILVFTTIELSST